MPTITINLPDDWLDDCDAITAEDFDSYLELYAILQRQTLDELEGIAFELGCSWDGLRGQTSPGKARALIEWARVRDDKVKRLGEILREHGLRDPLAA